MTNTPSNQIIGPAVLIRVANPMSIETPKMQLVRARHQERPLQDILVDLYDQHRSVSKVARALGITRQALWYWLKSLGMDVRSLRQAVSEIDESRKQPSTAPQGERPVVTPLDSGKGVTGSPTWQQPRAARKIVPRKTGRHQMKVYCPTIPKKAAPLTPERPSFFYGRITMSEEICPGR